MIINIHHLDHLGGICFKLSFVSVDAGVGRHRLLENGEIIALPIIAPY